MADYEHLDPPSEEVEESNTLKTYVNTHAFYQIHHSKCVPLSFTVLVLLFVLGFTVIIHKIHLFLWKILSTVCSSCLDGQAY